MRAYIYRATRTRPKRVIYDNLMNIDMVFAHGEWTMILKRLDHTSIHVKMSEVEQIGVIDGQSNEIKEIRA